MAIRAVLPALVHVGGRDRPARPSDVDFRYVQDERFLRSLHKRMFAQVWRWAGDFRTTARNIGIDAYRIGVELRQLLDDVRYWSEHHTYSADEIAVRFHHRLVAIHPFPNGNDDTPG